MEKTELTIEKKTRSYAKIYASLIDDEFQRKRANAAITALFAYADFLSRYSYIDIKNSMTLYRSPKLCEKFELADFYVNNYHIDVRVTTDENVVFLPKVHYDNNIVPDFYAVIKVDNDLKTAELVGIIDTAKTKPEPCDYHYFKVSAHEFLTNDDFIQIIRTEKVQNFEEKEHEFFKENYLCFIDNELNAEKRNKVLQHIFKCPYCRAEYCCFVGFEMVNCNASKYPELFEDQTLNIIGAANNEDEYKSEIMPDEDSKSQDSKIQDSELQDNEHPDIELQESEDTTKMNYIPDEDFKESENETDSQSDITLEHKSEDLSIIVEDETEGILDELFDSGEGKESEIREVESEELFEDVPKGVEFNPNEIEVIDDGVTYGDSEDLTILEKDNSEDLTFSDDKGMELNNPNNEKVIIDYDENGDAVYSYMTSAEESEIEEIKDIEDINNSQSSDNSLTLNAEEENDELIDITIDNLQENTDDGEENTLISEDITIDEAEPIEPDTTSDPNENEILLDNSEPQAKEPDIMDQMFVDGALEREAQEQQEVSYNALHPSVESENTEISKVSEDIILNEENTELEVLDDEDTQLEEVQGTDSNFELKSEEEHKEEYVLEPVSQDVMQEENNENTDNTNDNNLNRDNYTQTKFEETTPVYEESRPSEEPEKTSVPMFEGYVESEINKYEEEDEEYGEEEGDDYMNDEIDKKSSLKTLIIMLSVIAILSLIGGVAAFMHAKNKNNSAELIKPKTVTSEIAENMAENPENTVSEESLDIEIPTNNENKAADNKTKNDVEIKKIPLNSQEQSGKETVKADENTMPKKIAKPDPEEAVKQDLNRIITKALSKGDNFVTLKSLNWYCSAELFSDKAFNSYMQSIDNTLKQNLKNNIMNVMEPSPNNLITVKFAVDNNRNLRKVLITESSGSEEVDKVVLQSINETFKGEKSPILTDSPLKSDIYYFKVVIKL